MQKNSQASALKSGKCLRGVREKIRADSGKTQDLVLAKGSHGLKLKERDECEGQAPPTKMAQDARKDTTSEKQEEMTAYGWVS